MVVEFDPANNFYPTVIASPLNSELRTEVPDDEVAKFVFFPVVLKNFQISFRDSFFPFV
jgi:hypothetical protein